MRLGIDFGTTRTVVAAVDAGRHPVAAFEGEAAWADFVPGVARIHGGGVLFGWDALSSEDGVLLRSIKRVVSELAPDDEVPGAGMSALDLVTGFLSHLRSLLVHASSLSPSADETLEAMVSVPANASTRQRYITLEAFRRAGFRPLGLINEPTAAAVELAHRHLRGVGPGSPKRYAVIYDFGGGTFDAAAVSLVDSRFDLLTSEGVARLGGDDIDEEVLHMALAEAEVDAARLLPGERAALLELCRAAKEALRPSSRRLLVDLGEVLADAGEAVLDVPTLYARCQPFVDRTVACVQSVLGALERRGIDPNNPRELGAVYLVGGSVAFPPVARTLRAVFKRKLKLAAQPHAATAVGLAVAADPQAHVFVRESTTRHFGVWREGASGHEKTFDLLISKDTTREGDEPVVIERCYRPAHPVGHLRYLECSALDESGEPSGDMTPWAEIVFPYDPELAGRADLEDVAVERWQRTSNDEIAETYRYGADGRIAVEIHNRTRGYVRSYELGALR